MDLIDLIAAYYHCAALAAQGLLTQSERYECNGGYQLLKRLFLDDALHAPDVVLTAEQNIQAYLRFKDWEATNADLVQALKAR